MTTTDAKTLGQTFDCKTPSCTGTARSKVGRYSYCDECRERRAKWPAGGGAGSAPKTVGEFQEKIRKLNSAAKRVDTLRAKAERLTRQALAAKTEADGAAEHFRQLTRELMGEAT